MRPNFPQHQTLLTTSWQVKNGVLQEESSLLTILRVLLLYLFYMLQCQSDVWAIVFNIVRIFLLHYCAFLTFALNVLFHDCIENIYIAVSARKYRARGIGKQIVTRTTKLLLRIGLGMQLVGRG